MSTAENSKAGSDADDLLIGFDEALAVMPLPALALRGNHVAGANDQMKELLRHGNALIGSPAWDVIKFPEPSGDDVAAGMWQPLILQPLDGEEFETRAWVNQIAPSSGGLPFILIHVLLPEMSAPKSDSDELLRHMTPIVHEFRTPLNAIVGFSDIMMKQLFGDLNERYLEFADDINSSAHTLLKIVDATLDLSRLRLKKERLDEGLVVMSDLVAKTTALIKPLAEEKGIVIDIDQASEFATVYADETRMLQVILNLISNAVKYSNAGANVWVHAEINDTGDVIMEVRDTGFGMTDAEVASVMKPFERTERAKNAKIKGAGLGLPISEAIMASHQGTLTLESAKGEGTCARIWLPSERVLVAGASTAMSGAGGVGNGLSRSLARKPEAKTETE